MTWKDFKYSYESSQSELRYRPYVKVTVTVNNQHLTLNAIVDSGSQETLINIGFAPLFNMDLTTSHGNIGGVGGLGSLGYDAQSILMFPEMDTLKIQSPVTFTQFPADMLLGQNAFFKNFNILFQGREGIFKLNKVKNYSDEQ